ncbi:carboxymuconolactone decarboxylase family protein [Chloroflexota bacterium]
MARVRYVAREDLPESQHHIYDEIADSRGIRAIGNGFEALLNSPEAAAHIGTLGAYLRFQSELPATTRELVTIAVAQELGCDYEQTHHERLARKAGVSDASIATIREGKAPDGLLQDEATVVRYAQELLRHHHVTEDMFDTVLKQLGTRGLIDLTLLVGYYAMLAMAFLALNVELEEGLIPRPDR